jgi:hypothetical protein
MQRVARQELAAIEEKDTYIGDKRKRDLDAYKRKGDTNLAWATEFSLFVPRSVVSLMQ